MKTGALIPIRLASERLPGKALMKIKDKTILQHLVERALQSRYLDKENIVVCTTKNPEDDVLEEEVNRLGIKIFRGSTDNIIDRFKCAVHHYKLDYIIQIDGDDPFSDPYYMDFCMDSLLSDETLDLVYCEGLPLGISTKAIKSEAINKVWEFHLSEKNDTGFIWYFTKTGLCNIKVLKPVSNKHINNVVRLTLDYKEDFMLFEEIFNALYSSNAVFLLEEILDLFEKRPELMDINRYLNTQYWERTKDKVNLKYKDASGVIKKVEV